MKDGSRFMENQKLIKSIWRLESWLGASLIANVIMLWAIVNKLFFY